MIGEYLFGLLHYGVITRGIPSKSVFCIVFILQMIHLPSKLIKITPKATFKITPKSLKTGVFRIYNGLDAYSYKKSRWSSGSALSFRSLGLGFESRPRLFLMFLFYIIFFYLTTILTYNLSYN